MNSDGGQRSKVAQSFGAAAKTYDVAARIQEVAAIELDRRIAALTLARTPRILEICCGTGLFTTLLARRYPEVEMVISDLAPAMLERCRTRLGDVPNIRFLAMDGEAACFGAGVKFDLICSSLGMQWFADPATSLAALARHLAPGGYIAFATLGADSFREWRAEGGEAAQALRSYPALDIWRGWMPPALHSALESLHLIENFPDGLAFLRSLRCIGANVPAAGHRPASPGTLRRRLRGLTSGFDVTWDIIYGLCQADEA